MNKYVLAAGTVACDRTIVAAGSVRATGPVITAAGGAHATGKVVAAGRGHTRQDLCCPVTSRPCTRLLGT